MTTKYIFFKKDIESKYEKFLKFWLQYLLNLMTSMREIIA